MTNEQTAILLGLYNERLGNVLDEIDEAIPDELKEERKVRTVLGGKTRLVFPPLSEGWRLAQDIQDHINLLTPIKED